MPGACVCTLVIASYTYLENEYEMNYLVYNQWVIIPTLLKLRL